MQLPTQPITLYEKLLSSHTVLSRSNGTFLLYIDRHLVHEVTSPQAFASLQARHLPVRQPTLTLATSDHNVPTSPRTPHIKTSTYLKVPASRLQVQTLERNVKLHQIPYLGLNSRNQGIVHVIGPELGFTLPGTTIVCGDSHTSTHGAFGALAFGIGTSEVEHVLATQTIVATRSGDMRIVVEGELAPNVSSKDLMLFIIGTIGTAGGTGMVIEFAGPVIKNLSMESRMSLCNMTIEAGARAGLIAPDDTTLEYVKGRILAPKSAEWEEARKYWQDLRSDPGAHFDRDVTIDAAQVVPTVTWGTSPEQVAPITGVVPHPEDFQDPVKQESCRQALAYMGLQPGTLVADIQVDKVFIGSCTNARLEDFRTAARTLRGKHIASTLKLALAVPGSTAVKQAAEKEGLDVIFKKAGFQWREAGCSLCVGLNEDALLPFERCASTSNRNFESRQGTAGRTHLVSPGVAAATAIKGTLANVPLESLATAEEDTELAYSSGSEEETQNGIETQDSDVEVTDLLAAPKPAPTVAKSTYTLPLKGKVATVERSNVDTDAIFPKQFCTTTERTGLGHALFHNLRYSPDGGRNMSFVLNQPKYQNATFLLATGPNFGCGSSREHAVWALHDFGFRCVMAPSFADIFYNNAFKNGLLLFEVDEIMIARIVKETDVDRNIQISLPEQVVLDQDGVNIGHFEIPERRKDELIKGMDEIDTTLTSLAEIEAFEKARRVKSPWIVEPLQEWGTKLAKQVSRRRQGPSLDGMESASVEW